MVNGKGSRGQRLIGLPFTVYCLPEAMPFHIKMVVHRPPRAKHSNLLRELGVAILTSE